MVNHKDKLIQRLKISSTKSTKIVRVKSMLLSCSKLSWMEKVSNSVTRPAVWWFPCSMPIEAVPSISLSSRSFSTTSTNGYNASKLMTEIIVELLKKLNWHKHSHKWVFDSANSLFSSWLLPMIPKIVARFQLTNSL